MITALFEDEDYKNFLPITYTRPVFECRRGGCPQGKIQALMKKG